MQRAGTQIYRHVVTQLGVVLAATGLDHCKPSQRHTR